MPITRRLSPNNAVHLAAWYCPNVEELDAIVDPDPWNTEQHPENTSVPCPGSMVQLKTIAVSSYAHERATGLKELRDILASARNLETLVCCQLVQLDLEDWDFETEDQLLARPMENLRHMCFKRSIIDWKTLAQLLMRVPWLASFDAVAGGVDLGDLGWGDLGWGNLGYLQDDGWSLPGDLQVSPREAAGLLADYVPDLQALTLDYDLAESLSDTVATQWLIRDLTDLGSLESLSLDTRCLLPHFDPYGEGCLFAFPVNDGSSDDGSSDDRLSVTDRVLVDLLPPSIRELRIKRGSLGPSLDLLVPALSELARAARERFPGLVMVEISGKQAGDVEGCRPDFLSSGVEFIVRPDPLL